MAGRLQGKVALITGAGGGIGRVSAKLFSAEGARVVVVDYDEKAGQAAAAEIRSAGGEASFQRADVSKAADAEAMIAFAEKEFGALHVLFNNAGIFPADDGSVVDTEEAVFDLVMNVNLKGVFLGCKYGVPALLRAGGGSIVNTSSIGGVRGFANIQDYCAAKWGLIGLTKSAALEYAERNIRINAIAPGLIATEAFTRAKASFPQIIDSRLAEVPMGHPGAMDDVAGVVTWLLGSGSRFVTGAVIPIDGGERARQPA
jgi:NAD(P)-dependent dehydrogenase (short-subunit alcohol dehydrogenase family)